MKYIAAYALCVLGGKAEPTKENIEKVLKEAGIKSDADSLERVVSTLKGKPFHEMISSGKNKMTSMGSVQVAAGAATGGAKAAEPEAPKEEEADVDMGGLFGDDY